VVQTSASASSRADVEGHFLDFSGDCQCADIVMTKMGEWLWDGDMKGRVGDAGGLRVTLGIHWLRQPSQNGLKWGFWGFFGRKKSFFFFISGWF
jgi:hypothetical protein